MTSKVRYRQDLSPSENTAFVLLFLLPWLGILLLIFRKNRLGNGILVHDYLLFVISLLYWLFLFSITDGVLLALAVAALGSLCFAMFLLLVEECRMNKWSMTVRGVPVVILIYAVLLPLLSFDVASEMRNVPAEHLPKCAGEIQMVAILILTVIGQLLVAAKAFVASPSLLSGYFDEIPDNEGLGLLLSFFGVIAVVVWPLVNENVPNLFMLISSCIQK
ncbi:MAG: hypothetical protein BMS9Abin10_0349 [Gammaproteobacteria bacterium]|nr:MAG: hypothetical protein BMS9Abin10_0349 [Gammaproteobacteria bacterium]